VIPDTLGALIAFLGLVAPGLLFEMLRERRVPASEESAFREASRVALMSLVFTLFALAVLTITGLLEPHWLPDVDRWINCGASYAKAHYRLILRAVLLELLIAGAAVVLLDLALSKWGSGQGELSSTSVWYHVFRTDRPADHGSWVHAKLSDGSEIWGFVQWYTYDNSLDDRELSLSGPGLKIKRTPDSEAQELPEWNSLIVRGSDITYMTVSYVSTT
jgi:hypothetical protein